MAVTIECSTSFDITATGIRGRLENLHLPVNDAQGSLITDLSGLHRARNQQRNYETLLQIISLRTLPESVTRPRFHDAVWSFEFQVPHIEAVAWGADPVGALRFDAENVPMIVGLDESPGMDQRICTYGPKANVWFTVRDHK